MLISAASATVPLHALAQSAIDDANDAPLRGTSPGVGGAIASVPAIDNLEGLGGPDSSTQPLGTIDPAASANPTNYRKPKPRKTVLPKHLGPNFVQPLPDLGPYATAPGVKTRNPAALPPDATPTTASLPLPTPKRRPIPELHPYDATGLRLGSFRLTPYVESTLGYESNAAQNTVVPAGSWFLRDEAGGTLQSDWSRHEFDATLKAGYSDYLQVGSASRPDAALTANGRLDANRSLSFDGQGRFVLDTQSASTPGLLTGANLQTRPLTYAYGATVGFTKTFNRLALGLHTTVDRYTYDNANLAGGTSIDLANSNYNDYGLRGRAAYEVTPGIIPFVEIGGDVRRRDQPLDITGLARNSSGVFAKAGTTLEFSQKLTGQISGGFAHRDYADPRLAALNGPTFDAALVWSATPLTTLTLKGVTDLAETTVANASGALTRTISLQVDHQLLRNFTLSGLGSVQHVNYKGGNLVTDLYSAGVKADYNLTRSVVVRGSFTHQRLLSSAPGSSYIDNIMMLGLRLQR